MANPEHVDLIKNRTQHLKEWRNKHGKVNLDLREADLSEHVFPDQGVTIDNVDFSGANLRGAVINKAVFSNCNFNHADFTDVSFRNRDQTRGQVQSCDFSHVQFTNTDLEGVNIADCTFDYAVFKNTILTHTNLNQAKGKHIKIDSQHCERINLANAKLSNCDFSNSNLKKANFLRAEFAGCLFVKANLSSAIFEGAKLNNCNFSKSNFSDSLVRSDTEFRENKGLDNALGLESIRFQTGEDIRNIESTTRGLLNRILDWEILRIVGRLPLFGISYFAIVAIPLFFYVQGIVNDKIRIIQSWANSMSTMPEAAGYNTALAIIEDLEILAIPSQSLILLISVFFLAVGSTLYTLACPSRVKEFSRDQWCDELNKPLLHYWAFSWKYRRVRVVCAIGYAVGGIGTLSVIGTKIINAAIFIIQNTKYSWYWM